MGGSVLRSDARALIAGTLTCHHTPQVPSLTSRKDFEAAIKSGKPTVVDFYAP